MRLVLLLWVGLMLTGCATQSQRDTSDFRWWKLSLQIAWPADMPDTIACQNQSVCWELDYLLAQQVMQPLLMEQSDDLLWRFHRRAGSDKSGHMFSLLFFQNQRQAEQILERVKKHKLIQVLSQNAALKGVSMQALRNLANPTDTLAASSDPHWDERIQRSWPWFIKGVSETWLALINEVAAARPLPLEASLADKLTYYQDLREQVLDMWRQQGKHAYLHHLNAIFDYEPMRIGTEARRF